ncbi:hypothetical protein [Streptomyces sp. NPDC046727]|uniref:hypothetical protein n=1 Tax=Streptomyces sp. NPDC046727 TaxID=3155373 RepID=UPI0033EE4787
MGEIEELRRRVEALEAPLDQVQKEQVVIRHLAETAEIDAATLRGHRRSDMEFIRAMRDTQLRHGEMLRSLVTGQRQLLAHFGITPPGQ